MTDQTIRFDDGASYEIMMGRWSRIVGEQFLEGFLTVWSTIAANVPGLDVERMEPHNRANYDLAMATTAITK